MRHVMMFVLVGCGEVALRSTNDVNARCEGTSGDDDNGCDSGTTTTDTGTPTTQPPDDCTGDTGTGCHEPDTDTDSDVDSDTDADADADSDADADTDSDADTDTGDCPCEEPRTVTVCVTPICPTYAAIYLMQVTPTTDTTHWPDLYNGGLQVGEDWSDLTDDEEVVWRFLELDGSGEVCEEREGSTGDILKFNGHGEFNGLEGWAVGEFYNPQSRIGVEIDGVNDCWMNGPDLDCMIPAAP